jgi:serine phosphatase RsbU (regulator of sigma subunit)
VLSVDLGPGDAALLFTDGLVERRGEDSDVGTDRLVDAVRRRAGGSLPELLESVVNEVRDPTRDDDVAALALRRATPE